MVEMLPQPMMPNPISDIVRSTNLSIFEFLVIPANAGIQGMFQLSVAPRHTRERDDLPLTSRVVGGFEKNRGFHSLDA